MASVSSSTLVIFIASIIVAATVAGAMTDGVSQLSGALSERSVDVSKDIRTDIEIISDAGSNSVYNESSENLTLLLKNTGSQRLISDPDTIDVIIDGVYRTDVQTELVSSDDEWDKGAVLRMEVNMSNSPLESGSHRALVIVNENRDTFEFHT